MGTLPLAIKEAIRPCSTTEFATTPRACRQLDSQNRNSRHHRFAAPVLQPDPGHNDGCVLWGHQSHARQERRSCIILLIRQLTPEKHLWR